MKTVFYKVPLSLGSSESLRPSPIILKPNTTIIIANPGAKGSIGLVAGKIPADTAITEFYLTICQMRTYNVHKVEHYTRIAPK
jgi:hypothetical protein